MSLKEAENPALSDCPSKKSGMGVANYKLGTSERTNKGTNWYIQVKYSHLKMLFIFMKSLKTLKDMLDLHKVRQVRL